MLQRVFRRERSVEPSNGIPPWPDPMDRLLHPANQEFSKYLVANWQSLGLPRHMLETVSPNPELVNLFDNLADELDGPGGITKDTVYGVRLAATSYYHLVFAWAQGTRDIFVKLQPEHHKEALAAGGRLDATYPPDWVEFLGGGARMPAAQRSQWRDVILHWMQVSYNDSMKGTSAMKATSLDEPLPRRKLQETTQQPSQAKKGLRIILTLTGSYRDIGSLDPLCIALLGPEIFETAKKHRARSAGKWVTVVSEKTDLTVNFPSKGNPWRFSVAGYVIGSVVGFGFFGWGATPMLCGAVGGLLSGLVGVFVNHIASAEVAVRGDLADVMAASDALSLWLSTGNGRRAHLEICDTGHRVAEVRKPEDIRSMFQAAATLQEQGPSVS